MDCCCSLHEDVLDIFKLPDGQIHRQVEAVLRQPVQRLERIAEARVGHVAPAGIVRTDQLLALVEQMQPLGELLGAEK